MLARFERSYRRRNMKSIRRRDDHGINPGISQHCIVIVEGLLCAMGDRHALSEIIGNVANGEEVCIACFGAALEMRRLRNLSGPQHTHFQGARIFLCHRNPASYRRFTKSLAPHEITR